MGQNQGKSSFSFVLMFVTATPFFSVGCASQPTEDVAADDVDENVDALKTSSMVGRFAFGRELRDGVCGDERQSQWCMRYEKESLVLRADGTFVHQSEVGPVAGKANPTRATTLFPASGTWRKKLLASDRIVLRGDEDTERRVRARDYDSQFAYWRRDVLRFSGDNSLYGDLSTGACQAGCERVSSE